MRNLDVILSHISHEDRVSFCKPDFEESVVSVKENPNINFLLVRGEIQKVYEKALNKVCFMRLCSFVSVDANIFLIKLCR